MQDIFLIKQPRITEKSTMLNSANKYVFVVKSSATKNAVKQAVKELYRVDAESVNIVNIPGKMKRYRGVPSPRPGMKKAVVTLKEGQKIDLGR